MQPNGSTIFLIFLIWIQQMTLIRVSLLLPSLIIAWGATVPGGLTAVPGVEPIYDGEPNSYLPTRTDTGETQAGAGFQGSAGFVMHRDPWHSPFFQLLDPTYRGDLSKYQVIDMLVRCDVPSPLGAFFLRWTPTGTGGSSAVVDLTRFLDPPPAVAVTEIGTSWTKIRVPVPEFGTPEWPSLIGPEYMAFSVDPQSRVCYADNIELRDTVGPTVRSVTPHTSWILKVELSELFNQTTARDNRNYYIIDKKGKKQHPSSIGLSVRFQKFLGATSNGQNLHLMYLIFDKIRFQSGHSYPFHMQNIADPAGNLMDTYTSSIVWHSDALAASAIKVNQVGYASHRPTLAYIGDYLGDTGASLWVVGTKGAVYEWNRAMTKLKKHSVPTTRTLRAVQAVTPHDVWAVGDAGTIVHYDGHLWKKIKSRTKETLFGIDFNPKSRGLIVGNKGTILHRADRTSLQWQKLVSPTSADLRAVWYGIREVWIGGTGGVMLLNNYGFQGSLRETLLPEFSIVPSATTRTINTFQGVRLNYVLSALCQGGQVLRNSYGTWRVDTAAFPVVSNQTVPVMRSLAVNDAYPGFGLAVGEAGTAYSILDGVVQPMALPTTKTLHAVVMLTDKTMFAVGNEGACVVSNDGLFGTWVPCKLPSGAKKFNLLAAGATLEGPLHLPSLPAAELQMLMPTATWVKIKSLPLYLESMNYVLSGEDVYSVDFSAQTEVGTYRICMPSLLGCSDAFRISPTSYDLSAHHTCRMLYYQRSGMPDGLQEPYAEARFTRPMDHGYNASAGGLKIDGAFHWSVAESPLHNGEVVCPLDAPSCPAESYRDGSGGWLDAGDYSKYVTPAAPAVWRLFVTQEVIERYQAENPPQATAAATEAEDWNIPESGNGVPDLIDEATWEVKWMLKMQADDGGVYNKLASEVWEGGPPGASDLGGQKVRYFLPKSTHDTGIVGAVFAHASRMWRAYDGPFSATLLEHARLAWSFLHTHPNPLPVDGFTNPPGHISGQYYDNVDADNRAWLAAELYRTTCERPYGDYYTDYIRNTTRVDLGYNDFQHFGKEAAWAFYHANCSAVTVEPAYYTEVRDMCYEDFRFKLQELKSQIFGNVYKNIGRTDVPQWIGWGAFGLNVDSFYGVLGYHILRDSKQLDWLSMSMDTVLGANPLSTTFITGLGVRSPLDPLQGQSRTDNVTTPIPGYGIMGPYAHVGASNPYFAAAQADANNYPSLVDVASPFPVLRRWSDVNVLPEYNEGTVGSATFQCGIFQVLRATSKAAV